MGDVDETPAEPAAVTPTKSPKKKNKDSKSKKPTNHPKYADMIKTAISSLKERGGSSRQAILKYILVNFEVGKDEKVINSRLKIALRAGAKNGNLKQSKGAGASGSFKIGEKEAAKPKAKKASPVKKPPKAKSTKAKSPAKAKSPKVKKSTAATKKPAAKKAKSPKKADGVKKATPKKAAKSTKPKSPKKASPKKSTKKAAAKK